MKTICLYCGKPGGDSDVKHSKTAGVPKGKYHASCLLKLRKSIKDVEENHESYRINK